MTNMNPSGNLHNPSNKPQLQHCFMAGLRFDTEVEYLDEQGRWKSLCPENDGTARAASAQTKTSLLERINDLLRSDLQAVPDTVQKWQSWLDETGEQYQAKMIQSSLHALAQPLLKGLTSDAVILVQLALPKDGNRWMLVTGVECENSGAVLPRLRSLLVLDAHIPALWACGHNVRVSLPARAHNDAIGLAHKLCVYRTLEGGYLACTVQRIVVIQARA